MLNQNTRFKKMIDRAATEQKGQSSLRQIKMSPQALNNQIWTQKLVNFDQRKYPFPNRTIQSSCIYKTTVSVNSLLNQSLKLVSKIAHPNIISLRKILRSSVHSTPSQHFTSHYSLIYERVPYQLKYIGCGSEEVRQMSKRIAGANFQQIINSVSTFLKRQGVMYLVKLGDIGVTSQGVIKIYVPPEEIIHSIQKPKDKKAVVSNNDKLVSWWETTFSSEIGQKEEQKDNNKPNLSQIPAKRCQSYSSSDSSLSKSPPGLQRQSKAQRQSAKGIFSSNQLSSALKSSCKSIETELSKISAIQKEKMKLLNSEIKMIKERLAKNQDIIKRKDSDNVIMQSRLVSKTNHSPHIFQSQRLEKRNNPQDTKDREQGIHRYRQSIQQNINCINIYNHSSNKDIDITSPKESIKLAKTPVISYIIHPTKVSKTVPREQPHKTNYVLQQHGPFFDSPFEDIEDEQSLDTYDIELNANDESEPIEQPRYRQTFAALERDISEKDYKRNNTNDSAGRLTRHQNKVQSRAFTTESAGPLQFKNFVNKYIKPQFLAKRSNIYEDPMEQESQPSTQNPKIISQIANAGHSILSGTENSEIQNQKQQNKVKDTEQNVAKQESCEQMPRIQSDHRLTVFTVPHDSGLRSESFLNKSPKFNLARVQEIVEKSRKALNILNRVKDRNSPSPLRRASPKATFNK